MSSNQKQLKPFDFSHGFASLEEQEAGIDVDILRTDGTRSGMVITVAGPDSKRRKNFARQLLDERMKNPLAKPSMEDIEREDIEELVAATIGWRYPDGFGGPECTPDEVRAIYVTRRYIYKQVRVKADSLLSFPTKGSVKK